MLIKFLAMTKSRYTTPQIFNHKLIGPEISIFE
jgi:hypothetical protein